MRIWVMVELGTVKIDMVNTSGNDIDDLVIEGVWTFGEVDLTGYTSVTLAFGREALPLKRDQKIRTPL